MTAAQATTPPPPVDPAVIEALMAQGYFESEEFRTQVSSAKFGSQLIDTPLMWDLPVDGSTLDNAKRNLERVDVLGVHEESDDFLDRLGRRMGWTIDREIRVNSGPPVELADSFRRRIEEGNALDRELYEHARALLARR